MQHPFQADAKQDYVTMPTSVFRDIIAWDGSMPPPEKQNTRSRAEPHCGLFCNAGTDPHPLHIHVNHFQVMSFQGVEYSNFRTGEKEIQKLEDWCVADFVNSLRLRAVICVVASCDLLRL